MNSGLNFTIATDFFQTEMSNHDILILFKKTYLLHYVLLLFGLKRVLVV